VDSDDQAEDRRRQLRLHGQDREFADESVGLTPSGLGLNEFAQDEAGNEEVTEKVRKCIS
jgi:hypothetical protein